MGVTHVQKTGSCLEIQKSLSYPMRSKPGVLLSCNDIHTATTLVNYYNQVVYAEDQLVFTGHDIRRHNYREMCPDGDGLLYTPMPRGNTYIADLYNNSSRNARSSSVNTRDSSSLSRFPASTTHP